MMQLECIYIQYMVFMNRDHDEQAILFQCIFQIIFRAKKSKKITKWSLRAVFPIHKRVTVIIEGFT